MKKIKIALITIVVFVIVCVVGFLGYASDYYRADAKVQQILSTTDTIEQQDDLIVFNAEGPTNVGMIFYPGAKVETIAYVPLLEKISALGITCYLVDMPFHMAIFDSNAANEIIFENSQIDHWYMAGHSMGGAMASQFASKNQDKIEGLILMGAYVYGDYPLDKTLTIYGTLDGLVEGDIDYTQGVVTIEGGNHAQFGNYGAQDKDHKATISSEEQQDQTVDAIENFIEK